MINYIKEELESKDKEMFLVVSSDVDKEQSWLLDRTSYCQNIQERDAEIIQLKDIVNEGAPNQHLNQHSNNKALNNIDHCH